MGRWGSVRFGFKDGRLLDAGARLIRGSLGADIVQTGQQTLADRQAFQGGQLGQGRQPEIVQEMTGGGEQGRAAWCIAVTNDFDPAPVFELFDDVGADGHTADVFDVTPRDGLFVGNDGQCFQGGPRVLGRFFGMETVEVRLHVGTGLKPPAGRQFAQLHPAPAWPLAFALGGLALGLDAEQMAHALAFSWLENQVQAAMRVVPLGQSSGQRLLAALLPDIPASVEQARNLQHRMDDWQSFSPLLAILSSRHETQYSRLFRS